MPIYGPIPTGFPYDDTQYEVFTYDLAYAETILDAAGSSDNTTVLH